VGYSTEPSWDGAGEAEKGPLIDCTVLVVLFEPSNSTRTTSLRPLVVVTVGPVHALDDNVVQGVLLLLPRSEALKALTVMEVVLHPELPAL
jgi:hypothetical protein